MERNQIQISIELESGEIAHLQLSPTSYKQTFRAFKKKYRINEAQAFKIKNMIQAKLIEIVEQKSMRVQFSPPSKTREKEEVKESPRFHRDYNDEQSQTDFEFDTIRKQQKSKNVKQKKNHQQLVSSDSNEEQMPLTPVKTVQKKSRQNKRRETSLDKQKINVVEHIPVEERLSKEYGPPPQPIQPSKNVEQQETPKHHKKTKSPYELLQIFEQSIPQSGQQQSTHHKQFIHKQKAKQPPPQQQKHKQKQKSSIRLDRLFYETTDCYKSKKNKDVNSKEVLDYMEMEKYELSNKLKRTNKQFFYHLHHNSTESWEARISPSKRPEQEQESFEIPPAKKVSLDKAFKGSNWEPRAYCAAKVYQNKLQAQRLFREKEEERIKKRMQFQSKHKYPESKQKTHVSRVCYKCSPKYGKAEVKNIKEKVKPKIQKNKTPSPKKSYLSTILQDSYEERCKKTRQLQLS